MSEETRKEIATVINSILMSNTRRMTIKQLNINFQQIEGHGIPHQEFGCMSLEQFLRTLKDKVMVCGSGLNAEVRPVVSPKAAHVNDLVANQRKPKRKTSRANNRRYYQQPNRQYVTFNQSNYVHQSNYVPDQSNYVHHLSNYVYHQSNYIHHQSNYAHHQSNYVPPPSLLNIKTQIPTSLQFKNTTSLDNKFDSPSTSSKGAVPKQTANINNDVDDIYFSDEENIRNSKVPQIIQDRLWRLIAKHPDGILCSNILEIYRKQYQETLSYSDYGYRSIAQMCVDLRGIFNIVQLDKSEIKLFDKRKPIPTDTLNIAKKLQLMKIKASVETPTENALPENEVEEMMSEVYSERLPPDAFKFGNKLEKQWLDPGTTEQDYLDVYVAEVYDPSKFWINLKPYANLLNELMDKMQIYYAMHKLELLVPYYALKKDLYITCIFANEYHRARIVDTSHKNESAIKVYFVDYGTVEMINIQGICYLHNQFTELPEQAVRARLAGIYPSSENEQWSRSVASRFLSFVLQKDLLAQLIRIDEEQRILDIILADTTEEDEDFFINDALVAMGYASFTFQERKPAQNTEIVPIVRYIHLYPTHYELENGMVPTAVQMINMHQAGLVIEQIYPHYFKDAKTGLPISSKHVIVKQNLPVNFEIERPYYEENVDQDICKEEEEEPLNEDSTNLDATVVSHWEDIIEEVELNSTAIDDNDSNDVCLQNPKDKIITEAEQIRDSNSYNNSSDIVKETSSKNHLQITINNNFACTQTDDKTEIGNQSEINNIQIEAQTNHDQSNSYAKINLTPKEHMSKTNNQTNTKKPLRPPPGYDNIPTHTVYDHNNTPTLNPNNYISNQTYINFPLSYNPYAFNIQMQAPSNYLPYAYNTYGNILRHIQYLVNCGARLTPEQQRYLQTFNWNRFNYIPYQNSNDVQMEFPFNSTPPVHSEMYAPGNTNETQKNESVLNPVAVSFKPNHVATNTLKCVDQSVQVDTESECTTNLPKIEKSFGIECSGVTETIETEYINIPTNYIEKPNLEKVDHEHDLNAAEEASTSSVYESQYTENEQSEEHSENILTETVDAIRKSRGNEEVLSGTDDYNINKEEIIENIVCVNNDLNEEDDSVYEECYSSIYNNSYKTKFITTISTEKLNMHVINLENQFYFLLTELSQKILPKSFTVLHLRKLLVSPCIISVVDIRLKTNPELKKELLMLALINEKDVTVDAVPVKYFKDLIEILPTSENEDDKINKLLEEIENFLSGYNPKRLCS